MFSISAILGILHQGLAIVRNATDPDKKDKNFNVGLKKNWKKALDVAEDICELIDEHQNALPEKVKRKYKKLKSKFNDLD